MSPEALLLFLCEILQGLDAYMHLTAPPQVELNSAATVFKKIQTP
jgi:hypothetical protein